MTNCGSGSSSCCASLTVTGGNFFRTYTNTGSGATGTSDAATVSSFRLDEYEVTVGRFRQFVAAWNNGSGWLPAAGSGKHTHLNGGQGLADGNNPGFYETGWVATDNSNIAPTTANFNTCAYNSYSTWTPSPGVWENRPINCITWYEAYAFCIWDGGFLPSQAEWEYAAAGGVQQLEYPWGSAAPGTANQYAVYGCYYPANAGSCNNDASSISPVGALSLGVGPYGQLDLGGNVMEWQIDWSMSYRNPCTDCANLSGGVERVEKGDYWGGDATRLVPPYYTSDAPTLRGSQLGFRCARAP
jgi:formylglycine-generating enzyme required for sulfatase activity